MQNSVRLPVDPSMARLNRLGSAENPKLSVSIYKKSVVFFIFSLIVSKFFSETLGVTSKAIDLLNFPFFFYTILILVIGGRSKVGFSISFFNTALLFLGGMLFFSIALNLGDIYLPSSVLYVIGVLEGPILFLALARLIGRDLQFASTILTMFRLLIYVNIVVIILFSYPDYIRRDGNPDAITGTFGLNGYYLSIFLVAAIGLFFGDWYRKNRNRVSINRSTILFFLLLVFALGSLYLLQYRAAVPFMFLVFILFVKVLYGNRILSIIASISILLVTGYTAFLFLVSSFENAQRLKYGDILTIAVSPHEWGEYGILTSYQETMEMYGNDLPSVFVGVGPGNYTSRAYYTFSYEYNTEGKGVSGILRDYLGLKEPRFTEWDVNYLQHLRGVANYGSYQLSNPNSSYLAALGELGVIGGGILIALYLWLVRFSYMNFRLARYYPGALPLAGAAFAGTLYLFLLGFLENYWESARSTVLIWVLNWAAYVVLQGFRRRDSRRTVIPSSGYTFSNSSGYIQPVLSRERQ